MSGLSWGPLTSRNSSGSLIESGSCVSGRVAHLQPAVAALPKADLTPLVGLSPVVFHSVP